MTSWRCRNCGLEYAARPSVCPDCTGTDFAPVPTEPGSGSPTDSGDPGTSSDPAEAEIPTPSGVTPIPSWAFTLAFGLFLVALVVGVPLVNGEPTSTECPFRPIDDGSVSDRDRIECTVFDAVLEDRPGDLLPRDVRFDGDKRAEARIIAATMAEHGYGPTTAREALDLRDRIDACNRDWGESAIVLSTHSRGSANGTDALADRIARDVVVDERVQTWLTRPGELEYAVGVHVGTDRVYVVQALC